VILIFLVLWDKFHDFVTHLIYILPEIYNGNSVIFCEACSISGVWEGGGCWWVDCQ
jgi:hypothetical protein